jgi:hypothetical protein
MEIRFISYTEPFTVAHHFNYLPNQCLGYGLFWLFWIRIQKLNMIHNFQQNA